MMNQTRTMLLLALLGVLYCLFQAWEQDYAPVPALVVAETPAASVSSPAVLPGVIEVPGSESKAAPAAGKLITLSTDKLRLTVDTRGGSIVRGELLDYTASIDQAAPVRLLDDGRNEFFVAENGLVSSNGVAPDHHAVFTASADHYALGGEQRQLKVDLRWNDASGIEVIKSYVLERGSYVVKLEQTVRNGGTQPWIGNAYEQFERVQPPHPSSWFTNITNPSLGFMGAGWYSPENKFDSRALGDFVKEPMQHTITGGWAAMLQHYFFAAWIPPAGEAIQYSTAVRNPNSAEPIYLLRALGPSFQLASGQQGSASARLFIGPKLQGTLDSIAPGLDLTSNYGWLTVIADPLHWLLSKMYLITGNWGLAIILLVLLLKVAMWKLTAAQFRSGARMRQLQPRVQALRERYGDDKMKLQQAMMELYKKEQVNPMGGCLPMLIMMPVFFGLYRVLMESVELRHAPFYGWIHDLSAADPYFILPAIYVIVMMMSQHLTPTTGLDPTQAKMMKIMPLMFAVLFAFFPSGLVLYWVINQGTSLLQQWLITRQIERSGAKALTAS